jgi:hypothetical protein
MVALSSLAGAGWQFFDSNGVPLAGGKLYTYAAGTTTPLAAYTSNSGVTAHANPIILDSAGRVPSEVWLTSTASYKFVLKDSSNVEIWTKDNIPGIANAVDVASLTAAVQAIESSAGAGLVGYTPTGANAVSPVYVSDVLDNFVYVSEYTTPSAAALAAYNANAQMLVQTGQSVALVCNPTAGDDIQAMCNWISSRGHYVEEGGELYLQIADGLHNVSTYVDVTDARFLDVRATAAPDIISISSATFSGTSGNITATINVASALPTRVQAGFAVGGQNVQGDGGADLLNGGMIVLNRASSTQFTALLYSNGTNLAAFTTPDATPSLGLTPNQLVVPQCTIRAAEAGWDGATREGFMNALRGAKINLTYVGLSYNGSAGDNDMLFARDAGSEIYLRDYCVVAGTGEMVLRTFNYANIATYRSYLGGGQTGSNIWQGSGGGTLNATRTMMGSVTDDAISCSSGARVWASQCVVAGANIGLRTTYPDSSIDAAGTRVSRCNLGVAPTNGRILIDTASSIKNCTTPISITGSNGGTAYGNPTISGNTNATVTPFAIQASSGGVWIQSAAPTYDAGFYKIGSFTGTLDFSSISANSYADLTITATGAALGDFCVFTRSGTWPAQGISYQAFVSAADTVSVRAYNITTGAIDPVAFTALVLVMRAT